MRKHKSRALALLTGALLLLSAAGCGGQTTPASGSTTTKGEAAVATGPSGETLAAEATAASGDEGPSAASGTAGNQTDVHGSRITNKTTNSGGKASGGTNKVPTGQGQRPGVTTTSSKQGGQSATTTTKRADDKPTPPTKPAEKPKFRSYAERLQAFHDPNGRLMVCAHRADHLNYPENSIAAIRSSIAMGVDILELDIQRTKDGQYILMHDTSLTRMTDAQSKRPAGVISYEVKDWTLAQIRTLKLKEGQGGATAKLTDYPVATLEEMIDACKGKVLVNLDKAWEYRNEMYPILKSKSALEFCMFKSTNTASTVNKFLDAKEKDDGSRPLYVMMASGTVNDSIKRVRSFFNAGSNKLPVMVEMAFGMGASFEFGYDKALIAELKGQIGLWANTFEGRDNLTEWKKLDAAGYNAIQTDKPAELAKYIEQKYGY